MPLVSPQETFELLQIISSENESLQQVYLKFQTRWPALSADRFRACCFLLLALEASDRHLAAMQQFSLPVECTYFLYFL